MAIVFAVRGTSLDARYSSGGKTGIAAAGGWTVTVDAGAINGSSLVASSNNSVKPLSWIGRHNTPNGRAFSILTRFKTGYTGTPSATRPLLPMLGVAGGRGPRFEINHAITTGNIGIVILNELGSVCLNTNYGNWSPTNGTWYDMVFTWDGTTNANSAKLYIDASLTGQLTPSAALSASWANTWWNEIHFGGGVNAIWPNAQSLDEVIIWDSVIDPTSVTLDSGSGSLNGASRTSPVTVSSFDGNSYSDPGAANVLTGTSYIFAGVTQTGSYSVATYTDPGAGNVRSGTSYIYNNITTTGTLNVPSSSSAASGAINISDIKETIRYVINEANTTTGTPIDLSGSLSTRVKSVLKLNPEAIQLDANIFPYVTVFLSKKDIENKTIARDQATGKRQARLTFTIVGCVWNDLTADYRVDPADEDIEKLMENIEVILRHYSSLNNNCNWQFPTGVTYHTSPVAERSHVRVGIMDLQVTVYYQRTSID